MFLYAEMEYHLLHSCVILLQYNVCYIARLYFWLFINTLKINIICELVCTRMYEINNAKKYSQREKYYIHIT